MALLVTIGQGPNLAMTLRNSLIRSGDASVNNIGLALVYSPMGGMAVAISHSIVPFDV